MVLLLLSAPTHEVTAQVAPTPAHNNETIPCLRRPASRGRLRPCCTRRFSHCRLTAKNPSARSVGFIHVPKSGGQSIKLQNKCDDLYFGPKHGDTERLWHNLYCMRNTLLVLREPAARFVSAFYYALYGSSLHAGPLQDMNNVTRKFGAPSVFVDALRVGGVQRSILFGNVPVAG